MLFSGLYVARLVKAIRNSTSTVEQIQSNTVILQLQLGCTKESFMCPDRAIKVPNEVPIFKLFSITNICLQNVCEQIFFKVSITIFF